MMLSFIFLDQGLTDLFNLPANTRPTVFRRHIDPPYCYQRRPFTGTYAKLKLGAADFNA